MDDVLSLNNSRFGDFVDRIYPIELEIKDTTDTDRSASYLDLHLEIDSKGWLRTKLYDDDFNFPIVISYSYSTICLFLTWEKGIYRIICEEFRFIGVRFHYPFVFTLIVPKSLLTLFSNKMA